MTRILMLALILSVSLSAADHKISGVVTDSTGGAVAAVTVQVVNVDARIAASTKTDSEGKFTAGPLPPGAYVLSAVIKGFEPRRESVTLSDTDAFLRVALSLAKQQYSITVDGGSSQMDTASAHQDAFTLDQKTFGDLPVKDSDILTPLSSFVNPAGGAAATSSTAWSEPMRIFLSPLFSRSASTITLTPLNIQSPARAASRSTPLAATMPFTAASSSAPAIRCSTREILWRPRSCLLPERIRREYQRPDREEEIVVLP